MHKFIILLLFSSVVFSQPDYRTWLRGKVMYQDDNVVAANIVNTTTQKATISDENGEFAMEVKLDDELVFSSLQYRIRVIKIDKEILQKNRLVVDVNEKVTQLDEVVISPDRPEAFLNLKEEEFKNFDYSQDKSTKVQNELMLQNQIYNGVNFVNIFKALYKSIKKSNQNSEDSNAIDFTPSQIIRQIYPDQFFIHQLNIAPDKIEEFLLRCDDKLTTNDLLKRENEFELIDFLIKQSEKYNKISQKK